MNNARTGSVWARAFRPVSRQGEGGVRAAPGAACVDRASGRGRRGLHQAHNAGDPIRSDGDTGRTRALNLLGTSGTAAQQDIRNVVESLEPSAHLYRVSGQLRGDVAQPVQHAELGAADRHGPTHDAMRKGEAAEDFVRSVMNDPERALEKARGHRPPNRPRQLPGVGPVLPRRTARRLHGRDHVEARLNRRARARRNIAALTMRLRAGNKRSDPLASKFVFVTTNARFVRVRTRVLPAFPHDQRTSDPPVMLQRELATNARLRTGLSGTAGTEAPADIPRSQLIVLQRVLRSRREVTQAVHQKLREFAPERIEQYELSSGPAQRPTPDGRDARR